MSFASPYTTIFKILLLYKRISLKSFSLGIPPSIKTTFFVIDFKGNVRASEIVSLRREISGVLLSYKKGDEVLVPLNPYIIAGVL